MKCITRYEMKFGDIMVPARTECYLIGKPNIYSPSAPGVQISVIVRNFDLRLKDIENENKVIEYGYNVNEGSLDGHLIHTNTQSVYMYADDIYENYGLYSYELEKIFGEGNVPDKLILGEKHRYDGKDAKLFDVINYLEEEFAEWVNKNCDFMELTEDNIEDYEMNDLEVGDTTLTQSGLADFEEKCMEYRKRLETTGFTYDFPGGLRWS